MLRVSWVFLEREEESFKNNDTYQETLFKGEKKTELIQLHHENGKNVSKAAKIFSIDCKQIWSSQAKAKP